MSERAATEPLTKIQADTLVEMALHKAVDQQLDLIVQAAVRVAKLLEGGAMRENQLRNVLDTALHTESLELVANFIRYQIGRSIEWQRKSFGEEVIAALAEGGIIDQRAAVVRTAVLGRVRHAGGEPPDPTWVHGRARVLLARRFLGELNRAFLYADRTRGWKELAPILAGGNTPTATPTQER